MPCISFIVPVYNMERLLPRALRSLRAQTLTDFEAILINDGSKDGSAALCAQAVAEDARFRFIDQPNGGVATARNAGLDAARGEYIFFLDPDDWVEPDAAEVLYHAARNADADCVEFGLYLDSYDENDRLLHTQTSGSTLSGVYRGGPSRNISTRRRPRIWSPISCSAGRFWSSISCVSPAISWGRTGCSL